MPTDKRDFLKMLGAGLLGAVGAKTLPVSTSTVPPISGAPTRDDEAQPSYRRLIEKSTLRCGYAPWPGLVDIDPATGRLSGVFCDYMQELGRTMDVKVEWVEEVPFGEIPAALEAGRIDAHSSGAWTNPMRGKFVSNVTSVSYQYIRAFVRAGDTRFDHQIEALNAPQVTISTIDGESSSSIAATSFPLAKTISHAAGTEGTHMLLDVVTGKADVAFTDMAMLQRVIANNPGKVRAVIMDYPLQVFGNPIWVRKGETRLRESLDIATRQLINDGTIARILSKHETIDGMFLRPEASYRAA